MRLPICHWPPYGHSYAFPQDPLVLCHLFWFFLSPLTILKIHSHWLLTPICSIPRSLLFLHVLDLQLHCLKLHSMGEETQLSGGSFLGVVAEPLLLTWKLKGLGHDSISAPYTDSPGTCQIWCVWLNASLLERSLLSTGSTLQLLCPPYTLTYTSTLIHSLIHLHTHTHTS